MLPENSDLEMRNDGLNRTSKPAGNYIRAFNIPQRVKGGFAPAKWPELMLAWLGGLSKE
jgi:hypothetical protein